MLTVLEAADYLRLSQRTLERLRCSGLGPKFVKCGRSVRYRQPAAAIIADALASNRGLLERLRRGMYGPDMDHKEQYQVIFNGLYQTTREQIAALEVFAQVSWSE